MTPRCLICESAHTKKFLQARDYISGNIFGLQSCNECGFVFTWPQPANLDEYYPGYYRDYSPLVLRLFRAAQRSQVNSWTRRFGQPGRALEVGCGHGWMLAALRDAGWEVTGLERSAASARFARETLKLPVIVGDLTALGPGAQFELIILHQVLEHLANPMETLNTCARLLKPGGALTIGVPNLASWQFRFSRQHWQHLDVPRHLGHFTPESLRVALDRAGLGMERIGFVSFEYDPFGWVQSALNRLGFPQNLLLRWLAGEQRQMFWKPVGLAAALVGALLALPAFLLSLASWVAGAGAIMDVRAGHPKSERPRSPTA
jgi:SAM-dependent methyltransferase